MKQNAGLVWRATRLLVITSIAFLITCKEKEDTTEPQAPRWQSAPRVTAGARSIDITVSTSKPSRIRYLVTETEETFSADEFLGQASAKSSDSLSLSGYVNLTEDLKPTVTITGLKERTRYYVHLLARNLSDSLYQDQVLQIPFTTAGRQDTAVFYSQSENRLVHYLIYRPEEVLKNPDNKYPIIFFAGGRGERAVQGNDIAVISNGLLPEYIYNGNDVPLMVLSVQHITEEWNTELIREAMDHGMATYPGDPERVYLVGTSAGAFGVWSFAGQYPERLAAIVPISGGGDTDIACRYGSFGVWAFHNIGDETVGQGRSVLMVDAINECRPAWEAKLTLFPDPGHNCWRRVFDPEHPDWTNSPDVERIDLFSWLLSHRKN